MGKLAALGAGGPPAASIVPTDIAGLYAWYDADQLGLANNDPVASWTDESGAGRHATEATNRPLFKTAIQNGLPGVLFDGTDDKLAVTLGADASRTIFIVAKQNSTAAKIVLGTTSNSARVATIVTTGNWAWNVNQAVAQVNLGGGPSTNTAVITLVITSTSSMAGYVNNGSATSFDPADAVTTVTSFTFGHHAPTSSFWDGYIFEIVVYDTALGTTDRENLRNYLITKWGI